MARYDLNNKVVLITGGAGGLGLAMARLLHQKGAKLALLDVNEAALEKAAGMFPPQDCLTLCADITQPEACQQAVAAVVEKFGGLDVLVNNAAISHRSLLADTSPEVIKKVMDVNVLGAAFCTQAALAQVVARRGRVVAISSVAGFAPLMGRCAYSASKHALHGFFDTLRAELAHTGAGVMLVCPTFVRTAMETNALGGGGAPVSQQKVTVGKVYSPEEVAAAVLEGIAANRRFLPVGGVSRAAWWLTRLWPSRYAAIMRQRQGPEFGLG